MEENDLHTDEVIFLLRVLVGNSLTYVDADKFLQDQSYRWSLICFTVGAVFGAATSTESKSITRACDCSVEVLVELLAQPGGDLIPLVKQAFSSKDRETVRLREIGELAMEDLKRALKRFVFAMSSGS